MLPDQKLLKFVEKLKKEISTITVVILTLSLLGYRHFTSTAYLTLCVYQSVKFGTFRVGCLIYPKTESFLISSRNKMNFFFRFFQHIQAGNITKYPIDLGMGIKKTHNLTDDERGKGTVNWGEGGNISLFLFDVATK